MKSKIDGRKRYWIFTRMYKILKLILNFPKNLTYKDPRTNKSGGQRGCWIFWPIGQRRNKRGRWYNKRNKLLPVVPFCNGVI